ncbi:MAG: hypothetical protein HOV96_00180 [Nonomuraea sp.]|nr:hypothetical protein [Nonomuraea sp.]NUP69278.1 hypothetical protein [Nonomuraea sp.]NUP75952.1 hypothetical protein [Nonomuraea sp.]
MNTVLTQIGTMVAAMIAACAAVSVAHLARRQVRVEAERAHRRTLQLQEQQYRRERRKNLYETRMAAYAKLLMRVHDLKDTVERGHGSLADFSEKLGNLMLSRAELLLVAGKESAEGAAGAVDAILGAFRKAVEETDPKPDIDDALRALLRCMRADLGIHEAEIELSG